MRRDDRASPSDPVRPGSSGLRRRQSEKSVNLRRLSSTQLYALAVGIIVVVVVIFLIASGGVSLGGGDDEDVLALPPAAAELADEEAGEDDDASSVQSAPADGGAIPAPLSGLVRDEPFQFGDLRLIITDLRLSNVVSEGRDEVTAIERFASVRLTVRNSGRAPLSLADALQLLDDEGRLFRPNAAASAAAALRSDGVGDALSVALQPGITTELIVVFEVPNGAEGFRLRVSGGFVDVELDR